MTHAPDPLSAARPTNGSRRPWAPCPRPATDRARVLVDLRSALAAACLDDHAVPFEHLGAGPVRSRSELTARVDALADALLARMDAEDWDPGAAPRAVTSVLAASVPGAEAVLLRAARPWRGPREAR